MPAKAAALKKRTQAKRVIAPNPVGRPHTIEADEKTIAMIRGLGQIQATWTELAAVLNVTEQTLANTFRRLPILRTEFDRGKEIGKTSLRRKQWNLATKNATMGIFLGKNYLGQRDQHDVDARVVSYDVSKLSDAEFKKLEAALSPLAIGFDGEDEGGSGET